MTEAEKLKVLAVVEKYIDKIRDPEPDPSLPCELWVDLQFIFGVQEH
jgi:hypothetical protein